MKTLQLKWNRKYHEDIYFFILILMAVSLPFSLFLISVSQILLVINWIIEGDFSRKWEMLKSRKSLWFIFSIYLIHVIWLFNTSDFNYAFRDLRIKLPFLILPLVIGTSKELSRKKVDILVRFFILAILVSSFIIFGIFLAEKNHRFFNIRDISIFISHIRFALLINVAIGLIPYYIFFGETRISASWGLGLFLVMIWLIFFLFILQSFTGIVVFFLIGISLLCLAIYKIEAIKIRMILGALFFALIIVVFSYVGISVYNFYNIKPVNPAALPQFTENGNPYQHRLSNHQIENGHYIWLNVCEDELRDEWNKRSSFDYDGQDSLGQRLSSTIIRYLTSKGLKKDSAGIAKLSAQDIKNIEKGIANYIYARRFSLYARIYQTIWELDVFFKGANPGGHSLTQRFIYIQTGWFIIKDNFWLGVGTGDVKQAFKKKYEEIDSPLEERWRLRAHNQFLTFFIAFGIFAFLWICFSLSYPIWYEKKQKDYFFLLFMFIAVLSMFNEDTMETHAGISFFSFFYAFFLLGRKSRAV